MQAVKVFNNNAVSVIMPDGREAILVGNGLGFGRRPGDVIDKSRVSKVYYVQNELQTKFLKMLDNVTPQVMQAAERISLAAEEQGPPRTAHPLPVAARCPPPPPRPTPES